MEENTRYYPYNMIGELVNADTVSVTIISALSVVTLAAAAAMIFTAKKAFSK